MLHIVVVLISQLHEPVWCQWLYFMMNFYKSSNKVPSSGIMFCCICVQKMLWRVSKNSPQAYKQKKLRPSHKPISNRGHIPAYHRTRGGGRGRWGDVSVVALAMCVHDFRGGAWRCGFIWLKSSNINNLSPGSITLNCKI